MSATPCKAGHLQKSVFAGVAASNVAAGGGTHHEKNRLIASYTSCCHNFRQLKTRFDNARPFAQLGSGAASKNAQKTPTILSSRWR
jgi:hypothetical protein